MNATKPDTWQSYPVQTKFEEHAESWGVLNQRLFQDHPLGDLFFVRPLLKYFASGGDFLAVQPAGDEYRGMLLLRRGRFGVVSSFRPAQTEICPVLINSMEELQSLFAVLPRSTMALQLHCQDPDYYGTPPTTSPLLFEVEEHVTTVSIELRNSFEDYWNKRPVKLQQNIARCQRALQQSDTSWAFKIVESPHEVRLAVGRYGDLESRGWKRQAGTAVHSTNTQGLFYSEVLHGFAQGGKGIVYELYFEGQLVSSQLAIGNESMLITLKTTYDEVFSKYSPGKLLDYLTIQHEFHLGRFSKIEFCTNAGPELIRWGTQTRPVNHITVYRNKLAWRLARLYKKLKSIKSRWPIMREVSASSQGAINGQPL